MKTSLTLLVTTFERPGALARVLQTVAWQTRTPEELIVADDGSGEATRRVIEDFAKSARCPVVHSRQAHEGFRVCRSRNLALARASSDYIVQIDGDMLLHPGFLADHCRAAKPGRYVQGTRIHLDALRTDAVLDHGPSIMGPLSPGLGGLRRWYAVRSPSLAAPLARLANAFVAVKGCNQGYWLADALHVNGYDESMTGWGSEDKEFALRLEHAGIERRTLLFAGIAWHLHHAPAQRDRHETNRHILEATRRDRRIRCANGIVKRAG